MQTEDVLKIQGKYTKQSSLYFDNLYFGILYFGNSYFGNNGAAAFSVP